MERPFKILSSVRSRSTTRSRWRRFTSRAAFTIAISRPYSPAVATSAAVSFPKHDPPQPIPACRKRVPMGVEADALGDLRNIGAHLFRQLADFVDVADFERKKRIGGVLNQLRRGQIGGDQRNGFESVGTRQVGGNGKRLLQNGPVERIEHLGGLR